MIKNATHIYIYGGGERARRFLPICEAYRSANDIDVVVSNIQGEEQIEGYKIHCFSEITIDKKDVIFIAMGEQHWKYILENVADKCDCKIEFLSEYQIDDLSKNALIESLRKIGVDTRLLPKEWKKEIYGMEGFRSTGSIEKKMWEYATEEAAEYAIKKMDRAKTFHSVPEYHDWLMKKVSDIDENNSICMEFGVFNGVTINRFAENRNVFFYGFDSFEGLPEDWIDKYNRERFKVGKLPSVPQNVELIPGWYDQSLPEFVKEHNLQSEKIVFVHIDCDLYSSTKTVFEYIGKYIKKGCIIAFDEYFNYPAWKRHEFRAFQEWVKDNNINYEYIAYVENCSQVAVRIR